MARKSSMEFYRAVMDLTNTYSKKLSIFETVGVLQAVQMDINDEYNREEGAMRPEEGDDWKDTPPNPI